MSEMANDSPIGRLLEEISWEGSKVRGYREGGRGLENVLTVEVFMLLDFLPRDQFLGQVLRSAHGADDARAELTADAEEMRISLLPGDVQLTGSDLNLQPDAMLDSSTGLVLVEAKRIRSSSFQPAQLAREYLALLQECGDRVPLLLLVLGKEPPVQVKGMGRKTIEQAVEQHLPIVLEQMGRSAFEVEKLMKMLPSVVAWTTWTEIRQSVLASLSLLPAHGSQTASTTRVASALVRAIDWHA